MVWMLVGCFAMMTPPVTNPTAAMPPGATPTQAPAAPPIAAPIVVAPPPPPGSLWSEVGSRALIGMDGNARRVGDLITVLISESASTTLDATTDTSRSSFSEVGVTALLGLEASITKANPNMGGGINLGGSTETGHTGNGTTSRKGEVSATLTCEVLQVLPNGNLRIRGNKEVRVNRETQYITLEGTVRPRDILLDNTVRSEVLAGARLEITGAGAIASKQHQSWGTAVIDAVSPF